MSRSTIDLVFLGLAATVITGASPLTAQLPDDSTSVGVAYRDHRLEIETSDGRYLMTIQWRLQLRASAPFDAPPDERDELAAVGETTMRVRRARLKVGGHAYRPWLGYYLEYDFPSTTLLDWRMTLGPDGMQVRVGQWKVNYSRERVASSGTQQFVERSIVNEVFTLDRQVGLMLMGHAFSGSHADVRYYAGALTGTGAGASANDDEHILWLGRLEWQPLGTDPGMDAGDLDRRRHPALTVAAAAATNRSPYTSFSGSGGGQLHGFAEGGPGRYRVHQAMFETAFKYRGVSWQHETHWKEVHDATRAEDTDYYGTYLQAGVFPSEWIGAVPRPLEVGFRWAGVGGGPAGADREVREVGGAANWYFSGHANKVTVDLFRVRIREQGASSARWRTRVQWDVSF